MRFAIGNPGKATKRALLATLALMVGFCAVDLDAASGEPQTKRSATTTLHISAYVIPVVQASAMAAPLKRQRTTIAYEFEIPQLEQKYEQHIVLRPLSANQREQAILRTVVFVPE